VLPITGILSGARRHPGGRAIGGIVGITVSVLGGVISLIASGILGGKACSFRSRRSGWSLT